MAQTSTPKALRIAEEHYRAGRLAEAKQKCGQILLRNPDDAGALNLSAMVARRQGRIAEAVEIAAHCAKVHPHLAECQANLGECSRVAGMRQQAIDAFERALQLKPREPAFHNGLGSALFEDRQYERALAEFERAVQLDADHVSGWSNLAGVLRELGRLDEAATAMETALRLQPQIAAGHLNMALIRAAQERFGEAMESTARAIAIRPEFAEAHCNLGMLRLLLGDLGRGWPEYQWRPTEKLPTAKPVWRGEDLLGKTIVLAGEQGFGDTIQFVRYVPMLRERGASLARLPRGIGGASGKNHTGRAPGEPIPAHDFWCPLLNLPMLFGTTVQNIPARIPYLTAQSAGGKSAKVQVGLAWAGSPTHRDDARRSIPFAELTPILTVPDIEFINLQVGPAARQAEGSAVVQPNSELRDFADTASVIQDLDLLITVDTSVAHLAGAMGKPAWLLLAKVPDWRWLLERADSPWYPTVRLFRQERRGDWSGPISAVASELAKSG